MMYCLTPKKRAAFIKDFNNVIVPDPTAAMKELWDSYYPSVKG